MGTLQSSSGYKSIVRTALTLVPNRIYSSLGNPIDFFGCDPSEVLDFATSLSSGIAIQLLSLFRSPV